MKNTVVQTLRGVTLIAGGDLNPEDLGLALSLAPLLVAADGGAVNALDAGHDPIAVIGDFDSLPLSVREKIPSDRLFPIAEQNSTDFDKAIRHISAPVILGVGCLGARIDHQLAAFNALVRHPNRPCVLIGEREVIFHVPPVLELKLAAGEVVSLFPMARVQGRSLGLEWPIDDLTFEPNGRIGTSNKATGSIRLEMDGSGMLAMVPRGALHEVVGAIASGPLKP